MSIEKTTASVTPREPRDTEPIERTDKHNDATIDVVKLREELAEKGKFLKTLEHKGVRIENADEIQAQIASHIAFLDGIIDEEPSA